MAAGPDISTRRSRIREVAMAVVIIARTIQARAVSMSTNAGGVADLLKFGGNRSRCCRQRVRAGADASARRVTRSNASRFEGAGCDPLNSHDFCPCYL